MQIYSNLTGKKLDLSQPLYVFVKAAHNDCVFSNKERVALVEKLTFHGPHDQCALMIEVKHKDGVFSLVDDRLNLALKKCYIYDFNPQNFDELFKQALTDGSAPFNRLLLSFQVENEETVQELTAKSKNIKSFDAFVDNFWQKMLEPKSEQMESLFTAFERIPSNELVQAKLQENPDNEDLLSLLDELSDYESFPYSSLMVRLKKFFDNQGWDREGEKVVLNPFNTILQIFVDTLREGAELQDLRYHFSDETKQAVCENLKKKLMQNNLHYGVLFLYTKNFDKTLFQSEISHQNKMNLLSALA